MEFRTSLKRVFAQSCLIVLYVWFVLFTLDQISVSTVVWAVGASALASSAFIVFVVPRTLAANPLRILGAYFICITFGIFFHYVIGFFVLHFSSHTSYIFELFVALSVGGAVFCMVLFKVRHPPAVGMSVVLILEAWSWHTILIIILAAMVLIVLRASLGRHLKNLC